MLQHFFLTPPPTPTPDPGPDPGLGSASAAADRVLGEAENRAAPPSTFLIGTSTFLIRKVDPRSKKRSMRARPRVGGGVTKKKLQHAHVWTLRFFGDVTMAKRDRRKKFPSPVQAPIVMR